MWRAWCLAVRLTDITRQARIVMTVFARAARAAFALSAILAILPAWAAVAGDSLLIWSPKKLSSHAYRLRTGARAAAGRDVSGGIDFSVATSSTGRIRKTRDNARLWAEARGQGRSGAQRSASAGYNPVTGRISASAAISRRWMATRSVDIVIEPVVSADKIVRHGDGGTVRVTQKAELLALRTGTSFIASGTAVSGNKTINTELRVEQSLFDGFNLTATVRRQNSELTGAVRARLGFSW